jgi:hypothetical protein
MKKNSKSYPFYVWSGLLTPEHQERIGSAIWLYLLFINMTTKEEGGNGHVLGGKAISYDYVNQYLGICRDTYFRWLKILKDNGYVETDQRKYGNAITVLKSKRTKNRTPQKSKRTESRTPGVREIVHLESDKSYTSYIKDDKSVIQSVDKSLQPFISLSFHFHNQQKKDGINHQAFKQPLTKQSNIVVEGAESLAKVVRLDNEQLTDIRPVLDYILADPFWKPNVVSLSNIRTKGKNGNTKYFNAKNAMQQSRRRGDTRPTIAYDRSQLE